MPLPSLVEAPASWTDWRKPSTAGRWALATISRRVSSASFRDSREMTKPFSPNFGARPACCAEARTPATFSS